MLGYVDRSDAIRLTFCEFIIDNVFYPVGIAEAGGR
jgi:hypothetical protein